MVKSCSNCYQINNTIFSFEFFDDNHEIYDKIGFQETTPDQLTRSLSTERQKFRLPKLSEIQKLISASKVPSRYYFFQGLPYVLTPTQLIEKKIYIQGDSQYSFPVAVIKQNNTCILDNVDYLDKAYLVFVVEKNN